MTIRHILFGALAASVALTSAASAGPAASSVPPPVGRIAKELASGGAKRVIVFASAGGKSYVATAGTRRPKADQRFRVGSVTKTFTATIVLQLVDEGKLGLSSTLEDHLPGVVPRGKEITIRQLLQHRSGLVNYTDYTSWLKEASKSPSIRPIDLLRFAGSKPLVFEPGTQWSYSNTNYIALGLVIEQVTGRSYADELEQRIFQPLGLDATELPRTRLLPDLGDDERAFRASQGRSVYDVDWANPTSRGRPAGSSRTRAISSRFYSALLSGRILSGASLASDEEDGRCRPGCRLRPRDRLDRRPVRTHRGAMAAASSTTPRASMQARRVTVSASSRSTDGWQTQPDESALVCPRVSARGVRGNAAHRLPQRGRHLRNERRRQRTTAACSRQRPRLVTRRTEDGVRQQGRHLRHERRRQRAAETCTRQRSCLVTRRSEDRLPQRRRHLRDEGRRQRASETRVRRATLPGHRTGRGSRSCVSSGNRAEIYVVNAGGDGQRTTRARERPCLVARRAEDRLRKEDRLRRWGRRQLRDLRHERRRQRAAEADARGGTR